MAVPTLVAITPTAGPASGGDRVRLEGANFASHIAVSFGGEAAAVGAVCDQAGTSFGGEAAAVGAIWNQVGTGFAELRTPPHEPAVVDVAVQNLDEAGAPIAGELVTLSAAYRFLRPAVARESDLTRPVRQLLRELKRQVLANVCATVPVDYDDNVVDGQSLVAMAKVPSLVLSEPTLRPNRFYSQNEPHADVVSSNLGPEPSRPV